ncbi:MAG: lysylphosphatidylglycerol synthase domain-containing protein [Solirubrobacteraceae bacterium]
MAEAEITAVATVPEEQDAPNAPTPEEIQHQEATAGRNLWRGLISLGLLIVLVVSLLLAVPGLHGVAHAVTNMNGWWIAVAVALEILSCLGYVIAFLQVFDRAPVRFGARVALTELAFGVAVSLGGAGSAAIGALILVDRGGPPGRVTEMSAVLFLLTSAVNVITLAVIGFAAWLGLLPGPSDPLLTLLPGSIALAAFLFFLALPRISDRLVDFDKGGRWRKFACETSVTIRHTERLLFSGDWRIIGAIVYLWCDIGVLAACFAAAGHVPPLAVIVLAYQIGYIANIIPIPGNIGILDGSIVGMFVLYGVSATLATAATVVYHAIALWVPAIWGTAAFMVLRRSRGQPLQLRPPRSQRQEMRRMRRAQRRRRLLRLG